MYTISANREQLGLHLMYGGTDAWLTEGLGHRPRNAPRPLIGVAYPRELVEHHLDTTGMWARVLNIDATSGAGHFGVISGMRFIQTRRYITNELDCYRQYPSGAHNF